MQSRFDFKRTELVHDAIGSLAELLEVVRRPPHHQIAVGVKLRALIVEAVRHFVTDHRADAAIIKRIVGFRIIERGLQNSGWKNDFVELWVVVSIHRGRRHSPFSFVHWPANFAEAALELEFSRGHIIVVVGSAADLQRFIVTPLVGVANLLDIRIQLQDCAFARFIAHPTQRG